MFAPTPSLSGFDKIWCWVCKNEKEEDGVVGLPLQLGGVPVAEDEASWGGAVKGLGVHGRGWLPSRELLLRGRGALAKATFRGAAARGRGACRERWL